MINLLPPKEKKAIMYARRNTKLRSWAFALVGVLVGAIIFLTIGQIYILNTTRHYAAQVESTQATLKAQKLEETQKRIQDLSNNLKLIIQVLSREVLFSKLLRQVGAVMPQGTVLSQIDLGKVEGGIDLIASTKDYKSASQIQVNLSDPNNKLFDKVDIVQVSCDTTDPQFPCKATLRALFSKNNPFLFINSTSHTGNKP